MTLVTLIITLAAIGVLLWAINRWVPMEASIKRILNIAVIIVLVLWLLRVFGFWAYIASVRV